MVIMPKPIASAVSLAQAKAYKEKTQQKVGEGACTEIRAQAFQAKTLTA